MTLDELKLYSVWVNDGSGCIFQPIIYEYKYTYILTAKHLFEGVKKDGDGNDVPYATPDGTEIHIARQVYVKDKWEKITIPFILNREETYFPHKFADAAILKIVHLQPEFDKIVSIDVPKISNEYYLNGFPNQFGGQIGEEYTTYHIREIEASGNYSQNAQLTNDVLTKERIEGMSGGGIIAVQDDHISIIGIQSRVKHPNWNNGKICFVPMKYFSEIINYEEYKTLLTKLHPPFLGKFDFLRDEAFTLKVDAWDENDKIESIRIHLRNKAFEVTQSNITPLSIRELFERRLLIDEDEVKCLDNKNIWLGWLEFLTIFNIIKEENITTQNLEEIFNNVRLKYTHVEDCTTLFQDRLSKSDYFGLKPGGTVIINSKKIPRKPFRVPVGGMINNIKIPQDIKGFRTDLGIDPFQSYSFVHLDYFKSECILNKLDEYENLNEAQLLVKLKQEYHELFN